MRRTHLLVALSALLVTALTVWGWHTFWFLTDDAHIEFRYASNLLAGRGLTWNPAPFLPVEGYTSLSWVLLLAGVWGLLGVPPPQAAPVLSLLCGLATLALVARIGARWRLPPAYEARRPWLLGLAFALILTNRTFFTWLSSGLETALFNLVLTWWICEAAGLAERRRWWALGAAATGCALTRPDGLLVVAATVGLGLWGVARERRLRPLRAWVPTAAVGAHVLWRHATYGAWLPNTYYAKHLAPWPEAGLRYLASFVLEYGLVAWLAVAVGWLALTGWRVGRRLPAALWERAPQVAAVGVLVAHAGYYCLVVGGDHFEYRVLSHLVPLLALSLAFLLPWVVPRPGAALGAALAALALSWPVQWVHWLETKDIHGRWETGALFRPIAPRFPWWARWYAGAFDGLQGWLIPHLVGMRHQEHLEFYRFLQQEMPARERGAQVPWSGRHTLAWKCVGVLGWSLPNVAIIDTLGLNDFVVARSPPVTSPGGRLMAHDRGPPAGYVECLRPDTTPDRETKLVPRPTPLTDEDIRACEQRFRAAVLR